MQNKTSEEQRCHRHNQRTLYEHQRSTVVQHPPSEYEKYFRNKRKHLQEKTSFLQEVSDQSGCGGYVGLQAALSNSLVDQALTSQPSLAWGVKELSEPHPGTVQSDNVVREGGGEGAALQQPRDLPRVQVHHRNGRQHHKYNQSKSTTRE
ncbi:uncharacterized protein [Procambarus clarkii]|uniref:uncharacterized protein n=1 Tax=Procambarus clarkii TaxID=6728 RepID=UPI00374267D4